MQHAHRDIMWLIDVKTLRLVEFCRRPPPYAALSHTWGTEEVSFDEFRRTKHIQFRPRFRKIRAACRQARKDGLEYAWIDTCCIDKSNNSELSEAINSMFAWYRKAEVCYAYLTDVPAIRHAGDLRTPFSPFGRSRWFRRGWTLQELIAPRRVEFYDARWRRIGEKHDLAAELEDITGIGSDTLRDSSALHLISLGRRMSWAADRETTRPEDLAYSMLGIFDVQMPLIYGEGAEKAFLRLQRHILEQDSDDDTLFAWRSGPAPKHQPPQLRGLFAAWPSEFKHFRPSWYSEVTGTKVVPRARISRGLAAGSEIAAIRVAGNSLEITAPIERVAQSQSGESAVMALNCVMGEEYSLLEAKDWHPVGIYVEQLPDNRYARARPSELVSLEPSASSKTIRMSKNRYDVNKSLARSHRPQIMADIEMRDIVWKGDTASFQYGFYIPSPKVLAIEGRFRQMSIIRRELPRRLSYDAIGRDLAIGQGSGGFLVSGPRLHAPSTTILELGLGAETETASLQVRLQTRPAEDGASIFSPDSLVTIRVTSATPGHPNSSTMTLGQMGDSPGSCLTCSIPSGKEHLLAVLRLASVGHLKLCYITFERGGGPP